MSLPPQGSPGKNGQRPNPVDSSRANGLEGHDTSEDISHQPSPAVIATASHLQAHVIPRRFLGAMPESVMNSTEAEEKAGRLLELRRHAIHRIRGGDAGAARRESKALGFSGDESPHMILGRTKHHIRVRRRIKGEDVDEDIEIEDNEDDSNDKKKKKKRKDVWVGESFDIGREFITIKKETVASSDARSATIGIAPTKAPSDSAADNGIVQRSQASKQTTQESFVTARTQISAPLASTSSVHLPNGHGNHEPRHSSDVSTLQSARDFRHSGTSSMQPLISAEGNRPSSSTSTIKGKGKQQASESELELQATQTVPGFRNRLKSAMRMPSISSDNDPIRRPSDRARAKSVQFPVEISSDMDPPLKGNKAPVDPQAVLEREGEDAAGTSHQAVEDALEEDSDEEDDEEIALPGEVIMRDRMLVKVAFHREENISLFDETTQRRNPCKRMERLEEYIVVWRKGRVEFYQDWQLPLKERLKGHKRLCFVVPLSSNRSTLSIYSETDMTLCLATSASRMQAEVEHIMNSNTTRAGLIRERVRESKQVQWLHLGKRGTHIFIMKIAERSRALDWYWELWRDLGGELPPRLDIVVPAFSTNIKLPIPEDPDMVGGRTTAKQLCREKTVEKCWEMMRNVVDLEELLRPEGGPSEVDLQLVWTSTGGTLDWIAYDDTVQGKRRNWSVLAGVAKIQGERIPRVLQLRRATHLPLYLRLEDGTTLREPPGVEGFLTRHDAATAKETVYISTQAGNVFVSSMGNAHPPLAPHTEGSTPADLFPDVLQNFVEIEHRRMASFVERAAGCIDFRNIKSVKICTEDRPGDRKDRSFLVDITPDRVFEFEARLEADAKEWVERLEALRQYWLRRHRVDARRRMETTELHGSDDPFRGTDLSSDYSAALEDIWDWCTIKGCRSVTLAGRLFLRKGKWSKFKSRYLVLTGGCLVAFKITSKHSFHLRKKAYPLFGCYVYSGLLASGDIHEAVGEDVFDSNARVYQDGLQSNDGIEDTTFCIRLAAKPSNWGKRRTQPWEMEDRPGFLPPPLTKKPSSLLIFRARSKLERDRWIWAINAEMERQVRAHVQVEEAYRNAGVVPKR